MITVLSSLRGRPPPEDQRRSTPQELETARLRSQVSSLEERHHQQMEFFVNFPDLVKALTAAMSIGQVTAACSRGLSALLRTRNVAIFLADTATNLRLVDGAGFPAASRNQITCTVEHQHCREVLTRRGVISCSQQLRKMLRTIGVDAVDAASIWHGDQLFGMIVIGNSQGDSVTVKRILAMVTDLTGVGLTAASRIHRMRREAERDALTGLANRRTLVRRLKSELDRTLAYDTHLSLAMIDVDNFKNYNDQNGHQAGDEALKGVAQAISKVTRRTDLVARYGGEEFTVLLLGADPQQALMHAERLRQTVASTPFAHGHKQPLGVVSISVGLATAPMDASRIEALFEAADKALYEAKEQGRNRVVAYSGPKLTDSARPIDPGSSITGEDLRRALALED
ncbi:MAG: GGDEF domain-containing protein [Deltaproteobacteria bacterium]|nr:GGDEF domain-containing protein [Deltaproteobacteria bacterium]